MRKSMCSSPSYKGFTLIELMITILVLSILAAIAVPTYSAQVRKSRRVEARNALLDAAAREERYFSTNNKYTVTSTDLGYTGAWPIEVGSSFYKLGVACSATGSNPCTDYTLTATAINTQMKDVACTSFTLTSDGTQTSAGSATAAVCWN